MAKGNEQIGTVPCPFPACACICRLFKYRPHPEGRRSAFTGKWYGECPDHGRIDGASGAATQEYLIDKGDVWGAKKPAAANPENPVNPQGNPESPPAAQLPKNPEPKPEIPAPIPEPKAATPPPLKKSGMNLLEW